MEENKEPLGEPLAEDAAAPEERGEVTPTALTWSFGAPTPPSPKREGRAFFGAFLGVIAFVMALLVLVLFLGDAGIKIFRETTTERVVYVREYDSASGILTPQEAAAKAAAYTVTISARKGTVPVLGSGFVYREDGVIVTNHHVIEDVADIQVILPSGEALDATVMGYNEPADLAVLKINRTGLVAAPLGASADLLVGDEVLAVGTPGSLEHAGTATFGKVSATARIMAFTDDTGMVTKRMKVIQTDTSVNPGNSGGPLVDMYGRVVGVVAMRISYYGGSIYEGMGFALPIDGVVTIVNTLIEKGTFVGENPIAFGRNLVGIGGFAIQGNYYYANLGGENPSQSASPLPGFLYVPSDGVFVSGVNGENAFGKLAAGDIITHVNGLRVYTIYDLIAHANRYPSYTTVTITYLRVQDGAYQSFTTDITLAVESGVQ